MRHHIASTTTGKARMLVLAAAPYPHPHLAPSIHPPALTPTSTHMHPLGHPATQQLSHPPSGCTASPGCCRPPPQRGGWAHAVAPGPSALPGRGQVPQECPLLLLQHHQVNRGVPALPTAAAAPPCGCCCAAAAIETAWRCCCWPWQVSHGRVFCWGRGRAGQGQGWAAHLRSTAYDHRRSD